MRQELKVNPRLYQAMDLLYMPLLDLQQHLKQELVNNPFLDLVEPGEDELKEEVEEKDDPEEEEVDWEEILLNGFDAGGRRAEYEEKEYFRPTPAATRDLWDHLFDQLTLMKLVPRQVLIGEEIIGNIDREGFVTCSLGQIMESVNNYLADPDNALVQEAEDAEEEIDLESITIEETEQMLAMIQGFDPSGIAARDLRETLLLQLRDRGEEDALAFRIVRDHFDELVNHRWSELSKEHGISPHEVQTAADEISKLDPKPGLKYSDMSDAYVIPDLVVEKIDGQYYVFHNDTTLPRLKLSRSYREVAQDRSKFQGENKTFISKKLNSAQWMIQAIEQRRQTMLKVMNFIVDRQRDFFEKGCRAPATAHAARGRRAHRHARVDGVTGHEREVRPDAAGRVPAQVLLLERALHRLRGRRVGPRRPRADQEARWRGGLQESAHRPGHRRHSETGRRTDRAPNGGQVPRPTRDSLRPYAQASMIEAAADERSVPAASPSQQVSVPDVSRSETPSVSIVIPAFNEAENMPELFGELAETLRASELQAEIVLVDDGSTDDTLDAARRASESVGLVEVELLQHRRNRGKTEALITAARRARGEYMVLFDADLQHSPSEIPRFVECLDGGADVVVGRKVGPYDKRVVSSLYNWLARKIFRVPARDLNAMKAFRAEVLDRIHLRHDWHRYLVVLAHAEGYEIGELDIQLYPRRHGEPKYSGRGRIVVGMLDMLAVWFQLVFSRKPMLFFGVTGLGLLLAGAITGTVALVLRFGLGQGYRPLLTLVLWFTVVGLLLFVLGFLAELVASLRSEVEELRREREGVPRDRQV
jgi:RNA polymerase sigma-54 factor